jgi:hypothetical protein
MQRAWKAAVAVTVVGACATWLAASAAQRRPAGKPARIGVAEAPEDEGLRFRLSAGQPLAEAGARVTPAAAQPLDETATQRVLARLPPLPEEAAERGDFALREASLPPPRPGRTVREPFPPPEQGATEAPPAAAAGALEVPRHAPDGEVPLAANLSVTFSQPMVAVTGVADLAAEAVPVRLTPAPPGRWRWVGTRTLLFEPEARFPMATGYAVEVPAGTRSATGGALAGAVRWSFATPPVKLTQQHPVGGPARRDTLLVAAFDQRVNPQDVLGSIEVRAAGRAVPVRLADAQEIEADDDARSLTRAQPRERLVVFRAKEPLPADAEVTVTLKAGAPSAEGPRRTGEPQAWTFRTFGPLAVTRHQCGWGGPCRPLMPLTLEFSNPLDRRAFRQQWVQIEPEPAGARVQVFGQTLSVSGPTRGRTTYRVRLSAELRDVFGQTLGAPRSFEFAVGPAEPAFQWQGGGFIVLDPAGGPRLPVYTINHAALRVDAYAVTPDDYPAFVAYQRRGRGDGTPPGRRVIHKTVPVEGTPDELTQTRLDLGAAFPRGLGHAVVVVEPVEVPKEEWRRRRMLAWVQATRIGLSAAADGETLVAWATSLADGRPLAGVELSLLPAGLTATSADDGLARFALGDAPAPRLVARRGDDVAFLPESSSQWNPQGGWQRVPPGRTLAWYVASDRGLYRPGEDVRVKGWVRRVDLGLGGDVDLASDARRIAWTLRDSQGNEIAHGERELGALGGFDLALKLPATMNLGAAALTLDTALAGVQRAQHVETLQVQEFRRPEFEVSASVSEGPHVVGGGADLTVSASYYAGGALPGADVSWSVTARRATYTPPGRGDFTFGEWVPWWKPFERPEPPGRTETFAGRTDASGRHVLRVDFEEARPPRPASLAAEAGVVDVNRQSWTARTQLLVHPSTLYVGLRGPRLFVQRGEPLVVESIVSDVDGGLVAGRPVRVRAERLEWQDDDDGDGWREVGVEAQDCELVSSSDVQRCTFTPREGGAYRVTARVADDAGRENETVLRLWVAGGKLPPRRELELEPVELVPDKKDYRPGDSAQILVLAPFAPAEGLLTLRRSGLVRTERFHMDGGSHTLKVVLEEGFTPNVTVQVDLVGAAAREGAAGVAPRPAYARGSLDLKVPPLERTLALGVEPREKRLEPGGTTTLDVTLHDAHGRPVAGGEVALIVADEAVLALAGYKLGDPLESFYPTRAPGVRDQDLRDSVLLARPEELQAGAEGAPTMQALAEDLALPAAAPPPRAKMMRAGAAPAEAEEAAPEPIRTRVDFRALALFAAGLATDEQGRAQADVKLPDSLTRYRVMAVAAAGARRFGSAESTLTARLPLMVRPSPPRFLNFGDRFELPVVVQNQTDAALSVDVAVRAANAALSAGAGRRVEVPPNDRVEVRFPAAAEQAGTARFQIAGASGRFADAADVTLPVWTPATTEAFATYGQIDQGVVVQPVRAPRDVVPQFGGLEVTTSSTALQALTDAVLYLASYPFECSEQLASRVLAVAALRDVLTAFEAEGLPAPKELEAAVARDLERLRALQNDDGGFGFWRRGDPPWPYLGVHAAHALERARAKGFDVPGETLERSRSYLRAIEKRIPEWYGESAQRTLVAYALFVRARLGDADAGRARRLVQEAGVDGLSFEALGFLLPVLAADKGSQAEAEAIRRHLRNRVAETASAAHFVVSYGDDAYVLLHSDRRADAVLLEALIGDQPQSDLIPKLVEGLLAHRKAGRWANTQENVFVLLALDRYFNTYEKTTPDFVARLWLGERYAGEQAFRGRSTERRTLEVPMRTLAARPGEVPLLLAKDGPGRLYYRIGLRYAPRSLRLEPLDVGFTVERRYEAVDDKRDLRRDDDGTWRVRAGSRVRVTLTLVAPSRRYHVALVDPLPAGLEAINPALATSETLPRGASTDVGVLGARGLGGPGRPGAAWWFWLRPWFDHQNLRDERVEAFSALLWEGVYSYSYVARATTPGTFVVPPAKAEEMYAPETFGRTGTDRMVVE